MCRMMLLMVLRLVFDVFIACVNLPHKEAFHAI